jgi:hypothetical protein
MVHRAKVDRWLAALLGGGAAAEIVASVAVFATALVKGEPGFAERLGTAALLALVGLFLAAALWGCYRTRYEIAPADLVIRFGPFRTSLPLEEIVEVFPTRNPLSAPAPSLDRLRVNYRKKNGSVWFALIAPRNQEEFLRDLAGAAPHLEISGDGRLRLTAAPSA